MRPSSTGRNPEMAFIRVDLPAPLAPISPTVSPRRATRSTPRRRGRPAEVHADALDEERRRVASSRRAGRSWRRSCCGRDAPRPSPAGAGHRGRRGRSQRSERRRPGPVGRGTRPPGR